jgi:hypothetical protein
VHALPCAHFSHALHDQSRAVSNLPALTSLNLSGCNQATDEGMLAVIK